MTLVANQSRILWDVAHDRLESIEFSSFIRKLSPA